MEEEPNILDHLDEAPVVEEEHVEEHVEDVVEEEHVEDEVVANAKKYGHLSKDDWEAQGKDPDQWKSPEEFDKTGKILDQVYAMRKKLDTRDREIQSLVEYQQRTSQREYDRAKQDLEQRLAEAKDDMDMDAVSHYSQELARAESIEQSNKQQSGEQAQQVALESFKQRNQHWFNEQNPDLMQRAAVIDQELKSIYPNASYDELAQKIEMRMQYEHPDRLGGAPRARPNVSSSRSSVNKTATTQSHSGRAYKTLSQDLKDTYQATKRIIESQSGREYKVSEFMDQLKKDGEL